MTKRDRPRGYLGSLKAAFAVGTLAASLLGTGLVAHKDAALPANAPQTPATVLVVPNAADGSVSGSQVRRASAETRLELPPVPTVMAPAPVARSRSSR